MYCKEKGVSLMIQERFFQLDDQWCAVHLPERPNGFAILILGDDNHFVSEDTSFWLQHKGRQQLLNDLREYGYTIFYSHLYGRNWGSPKAVRLAKQLIYYVLKSEILNNRIYILAEGMGALVALRLIETVPRQIRAVAMLSPCLDLQAQLTYEKEKKFFYKRIVKEISTAYEIDEIHVEEAISLLSVVPSRIPIKIWQLSGVTHYPSSLHCRKYEEIARERGDQIDVVYHLPEQRYSFSKAIHQFYQQHNDLR
jgi:hypothetical protein